MYTRFGQEMPGRTTDAADNSTANQPLMTKKCQPFLIKGGGYFLYFST
jgi:hypothetical protein